MVALDRCLVMGVLNVTPDSFSDGGHFLAVDAAVEHGLEMARAGADMVDVGGESTRPGATRIGIDVELGRVIPVVEALARHGVAVSIDTTKPAVMRAAIDAFIRSNEYPPGTVDGSNTRVSATCMWRVGVSR